MLSLLNLLLVWALVLFGWNEGSTPRASRGRRLQTDHGPFLAGRRQTRHPDAKLAGVGSPSLRIQTARQRW